MNLEDISGLVAYDESSQTGLRWLVDRRGTVRKGDPAGSLLEHAKTGRKCWQVQLGGVVQLAHRVIYSLCTGDQIPEGSQIDHFDGDATNNRFENLRLVESVGNMRNKSQYATNTTGTTGVSLTSKGYYQASAQGLDGKSLYKCFSRKKHGDAQALKMASEWRSSRMAELNAQGAGYTERHLSH
ncbi:HNH endonuclease signature motif containing protein [Pseudomonas reactans]|jgi:hypothetical protein